MDEAGQVRSARIARLPIAIAAVALAFAVLTALVMGGRLARLDHYALVHWMHGLDPSEAKHSMPPIAGLVRPFPFDDSWWEKLLDFWTYPASVFVSLVVFGAGCVVLVRRGAKAAAVVWAASWFVANGLEVVLKVGLEKPKLYQAENGVDYHLAPFDHSYPSGHMMRAVLVAAIVAYVWHRYALPAWIWAALVAVCLIVTAAHVPSDVIGGWLFGTLVVLVVYAVLGSGRVRRAS